MRIYYYIKQVKKSYNLTRKITRKRKIIDCTGVELTPGNRGRDCRGNGEHFDLTGRPIECCCDECDYMMCCFGDYGEEECEDCNDPRCPRVKRR